MNRVNNDIKKLADCYRDQYGSDTDELFLSMQKSHEKVALVNPFLAPHDLAAIARDGEPHPCGFNVFCGLKEKAAVTIDGLLSHYFLDQSSLCAPLLLPLKPHMKVLDMCAAPGGKLLVMISRMLFNIKFTVNDISRTRALRLRKVLQQFLPTQYLSDAFEFSIRDASYFGLREKNAYDAVLLDAPCSSEAHVVNNPKLLKSYQGISKSLVIRQYSLLSAALLATKPGGHVMYATCSINKKENEGVIERIFRKKKDMCSLVNLNAPLGSKNEFGVTILPHVHGAGPAFFSLLRRS